MKKVSYTLYNDAVNNEKYKQYCDSLVERHQKERNWLTTLQEQLLLDSSDKKSVRPVQDMQGRRIVVYKGGTGGDKLIVFFEQAIGEQRESEQAKAEKKEANNKDEKPIQRDLFGNIAVSDPLLRDKFIEPPFTVLDSKGGDWQRRKRQWRNLGIESHVGRDANCNATFDEELGENGLNKYGRKPMTGQSIFDPALCELMYRWFCPESGTILDPYAGGSVRGIVAHYLGYKYTGIDIRQEQVDANRDQAIDILPVNNHPQWYVGDSRLVVPDFTNEFDFIFTCPPYHDLEVYSDMPGDISNLDYNEFIAQYSETIAQCIKKLKKGGYACFVVSDIRDRSGNYRDFVSHTKAAFAKAGAPLYNDAVYLTPLGTAMLRADRQFTAGKKLVKVHENILVFKKY